MRFPATDFQGLNGYARNWSVDIPMSRVERIHSSYDLVPTDDMAIRYQHEDRLNRMRINDFFDCQQRLCLYLKDAIYVGAHWPDYVDALYILTHNDEWFKVVWKGME